MPLKSELADVFDLDGRVAVVTGSGDYIEDALAAGADALVMGTALLKADDPAAVVRACKELGE